MVARTETERINPVDASIRTVRGEVGNLEDLAPRWEELYPDEQTDFEAEWSNTMAHLRSVERLHEAGELSPAQTEAYLPTRARLGALLPTVERLGLARPKVALV